MRWSFLVLMWTLLGCGGTNIIRARAPEAPTQGLTKCRVAASNDSPLVTEWPASEKANLEALIAEGGVVVAYSGCEMKLLPQCRVGGSYAWQRTTSATDTIDSRSEDELYAKLPLGAVSLEGELTSSGRLSMRTTVTGQMKLREVDPAAPTLNGVCQGASHVLGAMSVGAFTLQSGAGLKASGGVDTPIAGGGVGTESSESVLRSSGNAELCSEATEEAPHDECRSPVQVFLWPLPETLEFVGKPGTVPMSFADLDGSTTWEVVANGEAVCETPCEKELATSSRITMREKDPHWGTPDEQIDLPPLDEHKRARRIVARADPSSAEARIAAVAMTIGGLVGWGVGAGLAATQCTTDTDPVTGERTEKGAGCGIGLALVAVMGATASVGGVMWFFFGDIDLDVTVIDDTAKIELGPGVIRGSF